MKIRLSLAALAALSTMSFAAGLELYEDVKTKQIFTEAGEGRQKLGSFVQENNLAEMMSKEVNSTPLKSKAKSIEIGGVSYLGFTSNTFGAASSAGAYDSTSKGSKSNGGFEVRRTYLDIKGNLGGGDQVRVTTDVTKEVDSSSTTAANIKLKYAYLWLNDILPATGVEMGMVHRAWIDYEENNGWYWRSINKVLVEDKMSIAPNGGDAKYATGTSIENSADLGINFRTKTDYFTSEFALLNGEGYDSTNSSNTTGSNALDFEYRITAALMGDGKHTGHRNVNKDTYADITLTGIMSKDHGTADLSSNTRYDRTGNWVHAVYNMPYFLVAGQMGKVADKNHGSATGKDQEYSIYSINADFRPLDKWTLITRYDSFKTKYNLAADASKNTNNAGDATQYIIGAAYTYSKNINLIANYKNVDSKDTTASGASTIGNILDKKSIMLTAEVKW